jgi:hypothetical protein
VPGCAIIDTDAREVISHQPFDAKELLNVGWARDDRPILFMQDGSVRTMDAWIQVRDMEHQTVLV